MARTPGLSKSRYQAGLQCPKNLWLKCHRPDLADPLDEAKLALFDQGHRVGALARSRFPGGTLVAEDHLQSAAALRRTTALLASGAECLYEAALTFDGVFARPDILRRRPDGSWELIEAKSSASAKPEHVTDAGVQAYVARGAGLPVTHTWIMHLNPDYTYPGGEYEPADLFSLVDVTSDVREYLPAIPGILARMKTMLGGKCPEPRIGRQCARPCDCGFFGHCHSFLPDHPVTEIPRIGAEVLDAFLSAGITSIQEVPPDHPELTPAQRAVCHVIRTGEPRFARGLAEEMATLCPPLHFLDFETFMPALPLYPGTHPHHVLPVQWSCHTLHGDGSTTHQHFVHRSTSDPRLPFLESLLAALPDDAPIVAYSSYEHTRLARLAEEVPRLASGIGRLQARLVDLERIVRRHVQHPGFHGHTSLKYVLPALVDDLSYDGLAVQNGAVASLRYEAALLGDLPDEERQAVFADLEAYCATDTLGLLRVYQELGRHCDPQSLPPV